MTAYQLYSYRNKDLAVPPLSSFCPDSFFCPCGHIFFKPTPLRTFLTGMSTSWYDILAMTFFIISIDFKAVFLQISYFYFIKIRNLKFIARKTTVRGWIIRTDCFVNFVIRRCGIHDLQPPPLIRYLQLCALLLFEIWAYFFIFWLGSFIVPNMCKCPIDLGKLDPFVLYFDRPIVCQLSKRYYSCVLLSSFNCLII